MTDMCHAEIPNTLYNKLKKYQDGWINSAEIFVNENQTRLINSKGADNTYKSANLFIEIIP